MQATPFFVDKEGQEVPIIQNNASYTEKTTRPDH